MKQTEIGMIPDDWEVKKIEALCSLITGYPFPGEAIKEHGVYPLLRGINITEGNIRHSQDIDKFFSGTLTKLENYRLCENDLVIGMDGSKVGKNSALINRRDVGALLVQRVARLREIKDISDVSYIYSFINSFYFANYVDSLKTSSAIPHISPKNIKEFKIPLPPTIAEQQKIAKALSDVDNVISTLEKLITKKKNLKQGTMQQLLTGKKRLPGFAKSSDFKQTEIGEIPEDWEVSKIKKIAKVFDGTHQTPQYVDVGIPFYSVENVTANDFSHTKYISEKEHNLLSTKVKIENGDILMTRIGSIGDCKYVDWNPNASFYVSLALIKCDEKVDPRYICFYSKSEQFKRELELRSLVTAIPQKINLGPIFEIILVLPSKPEQTAIANVLSNMDKEIEALNTKLEKYRNLKTGMMQQLLTGKIRLI